MTLIRFKPQNIESAPAVSPGHLLGDFMDLQFPFFPGEKAGPNTWSPALDVHDNKDAFTVTLEVPGLKKDDFAISWHDDALHITGERKEDGQRKEMNCFRRERFFGPFARTIALPAEVQADKISAAYKDGLLTITLPKAEEAKPKQIEVSVN